MNTNLHYVTWYSFYNNLPNIEENERVKVNMIWGCLWDESMQWLVDSGSKSYYDVGTRSQPWGNYMYENFNYTTANGTIAYKSTNYTLVPTGSTERHNANSIYDLAGNLYESILEKRSNIYIPVRGGSIADDGYNNTAACRIRVAPTPVDIWPRCACLLLYKNCNFKMLTFFL